MRRIWNLVPVFGLLGILFSSFGQSPPRVSAGAWPCFLCHGGFDVVGTDLAPPLAGSKLTDEQILAQVRNPRGMMPAFSKEELPDQFLKDGFIQPFIRALPAGRPTASLSPQDRASALATIAAVAATRAATYAQPAATPTKTAPAILVATPTAYANVPSKASQPNDFSSSTLLAIAVVFVIGAGVFLLTRL